jgi:hypothetical protein
VHGEKHQITSTKTQTRTKQQIPKHKQAGRGAISLQRFVPIAPDTDIAHGRLELVSWNLVLV